MPDASSTHPALPLNLDVIDLGRMPYAEAFDLQLAHHAEILESRESPAPILGRLLLVEHDPPVITISRRADARSHLLASESLLARHGVTIAETDRGGDITYHGPGQLVVYPILDLNAFRLGLHDYMRLLEQAVIDTLALDNIPAERDATATGVWVTSPAFPAPRKIAAMGVRVRRWVSMHGLALNITTNLEHFGLIVPCGLAGRSVTSLQQEFADRARAPDALPLMPEMKTRLTRALTSLLAARLTSSAPPRT